APAYLPPSRSVGRCSPLPGRPLVRTRGGLAIVAQVHLPRPRAGGAQRRQGERGRKSNITGGHGLSDPDLSQVTTRGRGATWLLHYSDIHSPVGCSASSRR